MPITGFAKIPDIPGESKTRDHEGEIEFHGIEWGVSRKNKGSQGVGGVRGKAVASPVEIAKFYDAASPYLALAALQGKTFDEIVLSVHTESGQGHLDYLVITMTNCQIKNYQMANEGQDDPLLQIREWVGIKFEKVNILYTVQANDGTAGDEHEIEYDLVAGV